MTWEVALFTGFGLLLGAVAFFVWLQREKAERRQVELGDRIAAMGEDLKTIAHDVRLLLSPIAANVTMARTAHPRDVPDLMEEAETAVEILERLAEAMRGRQERDARASASAERIVALVVDLLKRAAPIVLRVEADLRYRGDSLDVTRLVLNLLVNAAREAARVRGGEVEVELRAGSLRVTNPVLDPGAVEERMATAGAGGRGLGLGIARAAAARLGWTLRHELRADRVTFVVDAKPALDARAAN